PPQRPVYPDLLPHLESAEPLWARTHPLDEEIQPQPIVLRNGVGDREGARQERALATLLPASFGGKHVELPRGRSRALTVTQREDPVAAGGVVVDHLAQAAAERGERALGHRRSAGVRAAACISCRDLTSASRSL